jgi:hypothetical protein
MKNARKYSKSDSESQLTPAPQFPHITTNKTLMNLENLLSTNRIDNKWDGHKSISSD